MPGSKAKTESDFTAVMNDDNRRDRRFVPLPGLTGRDRQPLPMP